jgi:hypothetical protein
MQEATARARWEDLVASQGKLQAALTVTQEKLQGIASTAGRVFAVGTASIMGFVAAASPEAIGTLTGSFHLLAGEIGMAFIPQIMQASSLIQQAADWVRNLDEATKETIARWTAWGLAGAGVVMMLPRIVAGINLAILAVKGLSAAFAVLNLSTGGVLVAIGAIAALVAGMAATGAGKGGGPLAGIISGLEGHYRGCRKDHGSDRASLDGHYQGPGIHHRAYWQTDYLCRRCHQELYQGARGP